MVEAAEVVVVTARLLEDGAPAYLTADGVWSRSLQQAAVVDSQRGAAIAGERSKTDQPLVCDPYTFKVNVQDGVIDPLSQRERVRSKGPTIRMRRPD